MKKIFLIAVGVVFTFSIKAQIANLVTLPDFKDGDKLTDIFIFDPGLDKQLVVSSFYNSNPNLKGGIFGFATKKRKKYSILNTADLTEVKDLGELPKLGDEYEGFALNLYSPPFKSVYGFSYSGKSIYNIIKKDNKNNREIFLEHIFNAEGNLQPIKSLFTIEIPKKNENYLSYDNSKKEEYRVFTNRTENKQNNSTCIKYWVFDNKFILEKHDSITQVDANPETISISVHPYENGFCIINKSNYSIKINDLVNKKTQEFSIPKTNKSYFFETISKLNNSKLILLGSFIDGNGKNQSYGVFKFIFDTEKGSLEESVLYNCLPNGKDDKTWKSIYDYHVYADGICDLLICQSGGSRIYEKFEFIHFDKATTSWKKQLPIPSTHFSSGPSLFAINNATYITYLTPSGRKVDSEYFNNYTFGKPYPPMGSANPDKLWNDRDLIVLKITPSGEITHQLFENRFADEILLKDNELIVLQKRGSPMGFMHKFFKLQFTK